MPKEWPCPACGPGRGCLGDPEYLGQPNDHVCNPPIDRPDQELWARDRQAHTVAFGGPVLIPICWSDIPTPSSWVRSAGCQESGTSRAGLCPVHALQILGDPHG